MLDPHSRDSLGNQHHSEKLSPKIAMCKSKVKQCYQFLFSKHLDTLVNVTDYEYNKTNFWTQRLSKIKLLFFQILVHCAAAELLRWGKLKTFLQTDLMLMSNGAQSVKCEDKNRKRIWDVGSGTEKISTPIFSHTIASFSPLFIIMLYISWDIVPFGTGGTMAATAATLLCDVTKKYSLLFICRSSFARYV